MTISKQDLVTIRPAESFLSKQKLLNFEGISAQSAGSKSLCLHLVIIPPGGKAEPHYHDGHETAIYVLKGKSRTLYGETLEKEAINEAGDFLYIPPNVPHLPMNFSDSEEVVAVIARTDPNEQESVVMYNPPE